MSLGYLAVGLFATGALIRVVVALLPELGSWAEGSLIGASVLQTGIGLVVFGVLTVVVGRRILGLEPPELGWARLGIGIRGFGWGFGLATLVAALAVVLAALIAGGRWVPDGRSLADYPEQLLGLIAVMLPAALLEELSFRGVTLAGISRSTSPGTGIMVTSVLFAGAHLLNPGITPLATGNIGLAGLFLGLAFFAPGGLWSATGAHLGWNLTLAALGTPVSGLPFEVPGFDFAPGRPAWLTGGDFGPEGGLLATVALALGVAMAARSVSREES